jgi:arylsulfatase A-like enzyme
LLLQLAGETFRRRLREQTFARQKQLGVIPQDCRLTERPKEIAAWDTLSADQKRGAARLMETFAGFAEHTDRIFFRTRFRKLENGSGIVNSSIQRLVCTLRQNSSRAG